MLLNRRCLPSASVHRARRTVAAAPLPARRPNVATAAAPSASNAMAQDASAALLTLSQKLLDAIAAGDYATYKDLCDPSLTCFEPEAEGNLVQGMDFHKFYFDWGAATSDPAKPPAVPGRNTICSPKVRMLGDSGAVVTYIRLTQKLVNGAPVTVAAEETRVWELKNGKWVHVHFHKSMVK